MNIISANQVGSLSISPSTCVEWVTEVFKLKHLCECPPKPSVHPYPNGNDFITTMPALLPPDYKTFGVKIVSRVNGRHPALHSELVLFDTDTSSIKVIIDADWITTMRTGAVAALSMKTLRKSGANHISIIGLGSTARSTMTCIAETFKEETLYVKLMAYKDQAEKFVQENSHLQNVNFSIVDNVRDFMKGAEIVISCITEAKGLVIEDDTLFEEGVLVIPVHTPGFQNCDLFFDKVFGDDTGHIQRFKYFDKFKNFDEISNVLVGNNPGRENDKERILAYNVGLGLHDVLYSYKICNILNINQFTPPQKKWNRAIQNFNLKAA